MGNKSSGPLPSYDALSSKRFNAKEIQSLDEVFRGGGTLSRAEFVNKFGDGVGPAGRRVLDRLFTVLDANRSNALEFEEYVAAAFFFSKATRAERARVLFSMYCEGSHMTRVDVAAFCGEAYFAITERRLPDPAPPTTPPNVPTPRRLPPRELIYTDTGASPFRELSMVAAQMALAHFDSDRDGRLSFQEFTHFSQQVESGVDDLLDILTSSPSARRMLVSYHTTPKT